MAAKLAAARANNEDLEHLGTSHASLQGVRNEETKKTLLFTCAVAETSKNYL